MRSGIPWALMLVATGMTAADEPIDSKPPLGFGRSTATDQRRLEERFDSLLDRDRLRERMRRLTAHPHHVGSARGREIAEFIAGRFRAWGFRTEIESFRVLFPIPRLRRLELLEPRPFKARLGEPSPDGDADAESSDGRLPPYNAYSIDGDVTAELVYVNYGIPEDYEKLERHGIDVSGKIVIARYGRSWRGVKPKVAAERGAIGCILYSDPHEDGYFQGDVYPVGAFKNEHGAQRGSVADLPLYPGDPLTPGVAATPDAERLDLDQAATLTRIPVLPVSYGDALPLLRELGGPVAPPGWRGALPITYHLGPGPAKVRLAVAFDWKLVTARDVIARIEGAERPDQWILRGNHHDSWVHGARDPVSALVAMMEEARAIGELVHAGWRPRRTIVYAAWDAEEPGLIGSVEWVEAHAPLLHDRAAVYINSDSNGRGFLRAGGSHTLEKFLNQIARDVIDPQKGISISDRARAWSLLFGSAQAKQDAREREDLRLTALGSGSDYTPFLQHLGVASLHLGFAGESAGGEYHTAYDSYDHYVRFIDPQFDYGRTLAQTAGRATLRLAGAEILPFEFERFAETFGTYIDELETLTDEMRESTETTNRLIVARTHQAASDPTRTFVPPDPLPPVPHLNFAPLRNVLEQLVASARLYSERLAQIDDPAEQLSFEELQQLDRILFQTERSLTSVLGLPGRPWYRHQIYAPGSYSGYDVKTIPGVREAVESRKWDKAGEQIVLVAGAIETFSAGIDRASDLLGRAARGTSRDAGAAPDTPHP